MLDRRCARVAAVRLPFATRTIIEKDRPGGIGNFALSSARRSRNRLDEQAPRLSIARRRDGHGRANEKLGFAADAREYDFTAQVLKKLGAKRIRLLSNNPEKVRQLEKGGIQVIERVPCQPRVSKISRRYLKTKKRKMGHILKGI